MRNDYDVIIIGTGAGGGTLAHRLAGTGTSVLMVERGGYLPRERDNWESSAVFVEGTYRAPEFWLDKDGLDGQVAKLLSTLSPNVRGGDIRSS